MGKRGNKNKEQEPPAAPPPADNGDAEHIHQAEIEAKNGQIADLEATIITLKRNLHKQDLNDKPGAAKGDVEIVLMDDMPHTAHGLKDLVDKLNELKGTYPRGVCFKSVKIID